MRAELSKNEKLVLDYLRKQSGYISPTIIGFDLHNSVGHSAWASPICKRLVVRGLAHRNAVGRYAADKSRGQQ